MGDHSRIEWHVWFERFPMFWWRPCFDFGQPPGFVGFQMIGLGLNIGAWIGRAEPQQLDGREHNEVPE